MSFKSWIKGVFKGPTMPTGPTASQLYSGPQAFSGYQPGQATAAQGNLNDLNEISRGGMTRADSMAQAAAQRQANAAESSQRGAVMQQAQARGTLNSGNAFLGNLMAQQQGANRAAESGTNLQIQAQNRRQGAATAAAGIDMQRAAATDQFNQWASGAQANALQTAYGNQMDRYQAQQANRDKWWDRISGLAGGIGGAIGAARSE